MLICNQKNLAYEVCQTLMKVVPFEDNGSCSGSDTEVVNTLVSGSSQDTVYYLDLEVFFHNLSGVKLWLECCEFLWSSPDIFE